MISRGVLCDFKLAAEGNLFGNRCENFGGGLSRVLCGEPAGAIHWQSATILEKLNVETALMFFFLSGNHSLLTVCVLDRRYLLVCYD